MNNLISILIVNFNTREITKNCIDSIFAHETDLNYEVILWDNASSDGSYELFSKDQRIIYKYSKDNLGFSKANNEAYKISKGNYILYLNSDTVCMNNSIPDLFDSYKSLLNKNYDCALAPTLLNNDKSLQKSYFQFPILIKSVIGLLGLHTIASRLIKFLNPSSDWKKVYDDGKDIFDCDYAILACNMVKREYVNIVEGLDENYFFYHEDCDFGFQLKKNSIQQKITKNSKIIHLGGKSSATRNIFRIENYYRSLLYFYKKNYSTYHFLIIKLIFTVLFVSRFFGAILRFKYAIAVPSTYIKNDKIFFIPYNLWKKAIFVNLKMIFDTLRV